MAYGHGTGIEGGPPKGRRQGVEPAHVKLGPTIPQPAGIEYQDAYGAWTTALELDKKDIATPSENRFPDAIVDVEDEYLARCRGWLDEQIAILKRSHQMKEDEWDLYEIAYRAKADSVRQLPSALRGSLGRSYPRHRDERRAGSCTATHFHFQAKASFHSDAARQEPYRRCSRDSRLA
jgi:hypothetical protein